MLLEADATLTHRALVDRAVRWLRSRGCRLVYAEIVTTSAVIPDAIGFRGSWQTELVEVKVSRSDFFRDRLKPGHQCGHLPGRKRWYLTPPGLVTAAEVPQGWGLAEVHARCVRVVVDAPRLDATLEAVQQEAAILASVARRLHLGVPFDESRGRFVTIDEQRARLERP